MSTRHTVVAGEHLSGIANRYGFRDPATIWDDPQNASLRSSRDSHVLSPGDELFIPEKQPKVESCATTEVHAFKAKVATMKLRLCVRDFDNRPISGVACRLEINGVPSALTSDGDGFIEKEIPITAQSGRLVIEDWGIDRTLRIGHLDPHDVETGWKARLINLGYYQGSIEDLDANLWRWAIEEYQCDHDLTVTGELDGATITSLQSTHGS